MINSSQEKIFEYFCSGRFRECSLGSGNCGSAGSGFQDSEVRNKGSLGQTCQLFNFSRKKNVFSEDSLTRVKAIILISLISLLGMCLNLLLFYINVVIAVDDLVDSLVKVIHGGPFFLIL